MVQPCRMAYNIITSEKEEATRSTCHIPSSQRSAMSWSWSSREDQRTGPPCDHDSLLRARYSTSGRAAPPAGCCSNSCTNNDGFMSAEKCWCQSAKSRDWGQFLSTPFLSIFPIIQFFLFNFNSFQNLSSIPNPELEQNGMPIPTEINPILG